MFVWTCCTLKYLNILISSVLYYLPSFIRIQDDYKRVQRELDRQREDGASMEERFKSLMARATKEISEKSKELEDLKTQVC